MEGWDLEEDVLDVVTQEATTIVDILSIQRNNVLDKIYALVDSNTRDRLCRLPGTRESLSGVVDYFKNSSRYKCSQFLNTIWNYCENIPLDLEIKVLAIVGWAPGPVPNHSHQAETEKSPRSRRAKRVHIDHVQSYTNAVKLLLQQKYERVTKDIVKKVSLNDTWLCLRNRNSSRLRDRITQTSDGEEPLPEYKESVECLLKTTGRVVVLLGPAGSGKTLLMHCLGHHWAQGFYPSIQLLFLLEFRQLNLMSEKLSLKELLFRFFQPFDGGDEQSEEVFSYILSNPEKICFIFDGYDEFRAKFADPEKLVTPVNLHQQLLLTDLLSGLCSGKILPKCTVLVTCRPRDVIDMFGTSGYVVAELLGFSQQRVKEYTEEYFHEKEKELKERAVNLLMGSRHLLSMSHVPALCHVCCVCLDHLLSSDSSLPPVLPTSLTQIYLHILSAFLSRSQGTESSNGGMTLLQKYRNQITYLSRLAMTGLEDSRIVFLAQELTPELMNFGANAGILSRVELTCSDGSRSLGCAFTHLTMQEFMAALHLMTSREISEMQLKKKLNLKSRWTAKSDPKTIFTDSLHLFMCGLAAQACTQSLAQLEGGKDAKAWVLKRQDTILKVLQSFVGSASQTGPKIVELCRCAHETQDVSLATIVGLRGQFELRNIRLNPVDMDALAFVTSAANQMVCLDFGGCSMELECLNIIPNCKNLEHLIFRSRKYDDKFAEALSNILPQLHTLKQLDFINGSLTDAGAEKLLKALEFCPQITHLNVSGNSLSDESVRNITQLFSKLAGITSIMLGKNNISRDGIFILIEKMAAFHKMNRVLVKGKRDISVHFLPNSHAASVNSEDQKDSYVPQELTLNDYELKLTHLTSLFSKLKNCSSLTLLNLSKISLCNKGLRKLLEFLPKLNTIQEINVSDNEMDMDGVMLLSMALHSQKRLREIDVSHNGKKKLILRFASERRDALQPLPDESRCSLRKKLSLTESNIQPADMKKLCKNLVKCSDLQELDFSYGTFKDESIENLLMFLPQMSSLQLLSLSHNQMTTDTAVTLVQSVVECRRVMAVQLRPQGEAFIMFHHSESEAATCKLTQYQLNSDNVKKLCGILEHCTHLTDLDLSSNWLADEDVKNFLDCLPRLQISNSVSLHDNRLTQTGALYLVSSLSTCVRVGDVDVSLGTEQRCLIRFVQENVTVKTLCLRDCRFEISHLETLIKILSTCPRPVQLELSSNPLHTQSQLNNLSKLSSIQTLDLKHNALNADEVEHLVKQLNDVCESRTIRIEESWIKAEAAVRLVTNCLELNPHITQIKVEKTCVHFSVESLLSPRNIPSPALHSLSFDDCEVTGKHLTSLMSTVQKCSSLQELHFSQVTMGKAGAEFLSAVLPSLEKLKCLSLKSNGEAGDEAGIFALQHTPKHLECLSLCHHIISDEGAAVLGRALQRLSALKSLNFSQCSGWTAEGGRELIRGLVQCASLEEIRLESLVLDKESIESLAQGFSVLTAVRKISLNKMNLTLTEGSGAVRLLSSLRAFTLIEELESQGLRMGDAGISVLLKFMPQWTNLNKLNLCENGVSDEAGVMLLQALSHCRALQHLNLSRNNLGAGVAAKLAEVLPLLPHITDLDLSETRLGAAGCSSLCAGLSSMKALKRLRLTSVGTCDLVGVVSSLQHCSFIEDVSLAWNDAGMDVVLKLAELLPHCRKLKRLDLEANNINSKGAKILVKCLQFCPWVQVIRLWRNPVVKDEEILKDTRLNFSPT